MDINTNIQYIILFEIFKRFETERLYKVEDISSGPDELRKIVHTVITENDFINHDNETEEYFFNYINNLYDDIALHRHNSTIHKIKQDYYKYIREKCEQWYQQHLNSFY